MIYLYDNAPCHCVNGTQQLLKDSEIDFFDRIQWPGNVPFLNAAEYLEEILEENVENLMLQEHSSDGCSQRALFQCTQTILQEFQIWRTLFKQMLRSYHKCLLAVLEVIKKHYMI